MTVPPNTTALLTHDLTCAVPDTSVPAFELESGATLDLNGFTLTVSDQDATAVHCHDRSCSIVSSAITPGIIDGASTGGHGIVNAISKLTADNIIVRDFKYIGIVGAAGRNKLSRVTVTGCRNAGIAGLGRFTLQDVTANGNGAAGPSGQGILASGRVKGVGVITNDNALAGIEARGAVANLRQFTATGNGTAGVIAGLARLRESGLSGNGTADIVSTRPPRLTETSCERSLDALPPNGVSWGVCSLDP